MKSVTKSNKNKNGVIAFFGTFSTILVTFYRFCQSLDRRREIINSDISHYFSIQPLLNLISTHNTKNLISGQEEEMENRPKRNFLTS